MFKIIEKDKKNVALKEENTEENQGLQVRRVLVLEP